MIEEVAELTSQLGSRGWSREVDRPRDELGLWWITVTAQEQRFVVAFKRSRGFGLSSPDPDSFGEGHDETYEDVSALVARIEELIANGQRTRPPTKVMLARLREQAGLTQSQLADVLGVQQPEISKLEHREDMLLSTLERLITSMGGKLRLMVDIEGEEAIELTLSEDEASEVSV